LQKNNFTNLSTKNHFMKRLLFLGVLLMSIFGTNEAWSQEWDHGYMPFAQEGNTWEMQVGGVGSCAGPYSPWLPIPPENSIRLVFKNEGNLIFSFSSIYDEMSGGASPVYKTDKNTIPFDLQGRRLNTEPKHGVYIQNGKKVMK
jgi:hypothetical protein